MTERYRRTDTGKRADSKYRELSKPQPNGQTLFDFLLDCGRDFSIPGLFGLGCAAIDEELEWPVGSTRRLFEEELIPLGLAKADWRARVIWVPNRIKRAMPRNPNMVLSWRTFWRDVPECPLKAEAHVAAIAAMADKGPVWVDAFIAACPAPKFTGLRTVLDRPTSSTDEGNNCLPNKLETTRVDSPNNHEPITNNQEPVTKIPPTPLTGGDIDPAPTIKPAEPESPKKRRRRHGPPDVDAETVAQAQAVLDAWNEETTETRLPPQEPFGSGLDTRDTNLLARLRDRPHRTEVWWRMIFRDIAGDPGQNGADPRWRTQFHWLIANEDNLGQKFGLAKANLRKAPAPQRTLARDEQLAMRALEELQREQSTIDLEVVHDPPPNGERPTSGRWLVPTRSRPFDRRGEC